MNIEEVRKNRERFLILLYEKSNHDIHKHINYRELCTELKINEDEGWKLFEYLRAKHLASAQTLGGNIGITIFGIDYVEEILSNSGVDVNNPLQIMNFIHVQNMSSSQLIQGSTNASQTLNVFENQGLKLFEFVKLFNQKIREVPFRSENEKNEAIAEVSTIKSQLNSPKPKWEIIKLASNTVRGILEKAAGNIVADQLLELLK